jgi:hypothetical protein
MARRIFLGNLNKAQVAIRFAEYPLLNITAEALGDNMVTVSSSGEITPMLPTATGVVASPAPFVQHTISFAIVKTNPLAQQMLDTINNNSMLGSVEVTTDATTLNKQTYDNAVFQTFETFTFNGKEPAIGFTIGCYQAVNNSLFGS